MKIIVLWNKNAFNLLKYVALVEASEKKNLLSSWYIVGKQEYFNCHSFNCGYSTWMAIWNNLKVYNV